MEMSSSCLKYRSEAQEKSLGRFTFGNCVHEAVNQFCPEQYLWNRKEEQPTKDWKESARGIKEEPGA